MAEQTFNDFTKQARIEFVNYINGLEWNNELRTKCEDLLIAYDQMKANCDGMDETSENNPKALRLPEVVPRYFIDERAGCAAVRDREHAKYDKAYQGLHQDTPDVVVYAHGFLNHEKGCWEMKDTDTNYLKLECDRLNRLNGA